MKLLVMILLLILKITLIILIRLLVIILIRLLVIIYKYSIKNIKSKKKLYIFLFQTMKNLPKNHIYRLINKSIEVIFYSICYNCIDTKI
jgi:hypothetical protein